MNIEKFKSKFNNLVAKELANRIMMMIFAVIIGIEGLVIKDLMLSQRTIILPCGNIAKEFWITGNKVSQTYLETQGRYISSLLHTVNPRNAKKQFFSILPLIESNQYGKTKNEFIKQIKYLVDNDISTVFYASEFDYKENEIIITGVKNNSIGNKIVTSKNIKFTIGFNIKNGRFYIKSLKVD